MFLDSRRIVRAKRSFSVRRVPVENMQRLLDGDLCPASGDLVLARVDALGQHENIQLHNGRRCRLFVGDEIVVVYGNRYAVNQFEALVPDSLAPCHLAAGGGIASLVVERHVRMKDPTAITPLGLIADSDGRRLQLEDYRLTREDLPDELPPVLAVVGTSMDSGKTTAAASVVRGLARAGLKVGAAKVTGTGASGDVHHFEDSGAALALDFVDAGLATTYLARGEMVERSLRLTLRGLIDAGCEAIVVEVADGLLQDETATLLRSADFRRAVTSVMFAAGESMGALAGVRQLLAESHPVVGACGVMSASALAMREFNRVGGVPVFRTEDLEQPEVAKALCCLGQARLVAS